jgi:hypothetical protein
LHLQLSYRLESNARLPQCIVVALIFPNEEDPPRLGQLARIARDNHSSRNGRGCCCRRRVFQVLVDLPPSLSSFPDAGVKPGSKDPLLSNFVNEGIPDFGAPGATMDSNISNDAGQLDWSIIHGVTAGGTTSPENEESVIENRERRSIRRTQIIVGFVDGLTNGRRPAESVFSGREPDIVSLVAVEMGGKPREIEFAFVRVKGGLSDSPVLFSKVDRTRKPVTCPIGALPPNAGIWCFALPSNVQIPSISSDSGRLVTLCSSAIISRKIILLILVRGWIVCGTNSKEDPITGRAIREPDLTMPA